MFVDEGGLHADGTSGGSCTAVNAGVERAGYCLGDKYRLDPGGSGHLDVVCCFGSGSGGDRLEADGAIFVEFDD